jgi:hypothetical protein
MGWLRRMFGKPEPQAVSSGTAMQQTGIATPNQNIYEEEYHFTKVGFRQPGIAYISPLLQFQEYPQNSIQGAGTVVQKYFRPFEPLTYDASLQPVTSGTSGVLTGGIYTQPLIDTTNQGSVGG